MSEARSEIYGKFENWDALMLRAAQSLDEYERLMDTPLPQAAKWVVKRAIDPKK